VVRLRFTGTTPLAWRIRRDADLLQTEAASLAFVAGKAWIDKVEIDCQPPEIATSGPAADPITELRQLIGREISASDAFLAEITAIADELRTQLPTDCRGFLPTDEDKLRELLSTLAAEGSEDVLAALHAGTE
jgi:hypothetical protein